MKPLPRFDGERLVFIGDAAHATSPSAGVGHEPALTPFFQSRFSMLSTLRDLVTGPLCSLPPSRRLMLTTLAGVQCSFLGAPPCHSGRSARD